ncbi:maleylpyruvate isomerase N-terminal domain-containing protein [Nocardioides insulae]|uniref:maleylpyruvate isomerase N-terminal domain-containing protein n=1 Tax=Nocardioides insulae TaxID=394734 RepID=UPI0003FC8738|nr:maleylpyruvate isomerase N-terminal domain-containing protein [Nocardioides insulae]
MQTTSVLDQYRLAARRIDEVAGRGGDWAGQSPCEQWTAVEVIDHLIDTERDFLGRFATLPEAPEGDPAMRWAAHVETAVGLLAPELLAREFDGFFGPTTVEAVWREFYAWDVLVHRWDLGVALGQSVRLDDAELDEIEAALPSPGEPKYDAFYSPGICAAPLPVPADADRQTRVLARLGRAA